jgi:hypothetical protein
MGKNKNTIRKLPTGEKVVHAPDEKLTLVSPNRMLQLLNATSGDLQEAEQQRQDRLLEAIATKRAAQDSGDAVPADKRPV